jgi:hypothetical protein
MHSQQNIKHKTFFAEGFIFGFVDRMPASNAPKDSLDWTELIPAPKTIPGWIASE